MYKNKILTIVMPVFNGWPYLKLSVESILHQSFKDFNLIIVSDGSQDFTDEYISNLKDPRVKILKKKHSGIIDSFNIALEITDTKYIARVDADDYYFPQKLEIQIDFLVLNKKIASVGTKATYMS